MIIENTLIISLLLIQESRYDFMINLQKSYVSELGFKFTTPWTAIKQATNYAMKTNSKYHLVLTHHLKVRAQLFKAS